MKACVHPHLPPEVIGSLNVGGKLLLTNSSKMFAVSFLQSSFSQQITIFVS